MDLHRLRVRRQSAVRVAGTALCVGLLCQSWHIAEIDLLAESGRPEDLAKAIALDRDNTRYRLRQINQEMFSDNIPVERVKRDLEEVILINPRSSEALMDQGVLAESQYDIRRAEEYFRQAAGVDHTFKPIWTLANFYYRSNQFEKILPEIKKGLELTTKLGLANFDLASVYDLCWRANIGSKSLLDAIPDRAPALLAYFDYVLYKRHTDAAIETFPRVFRMPNLQPSKHLFVNYCNLLFREGHALEAVDVWNQLVDKRLVASTQIQPELARSIANPDFAFPFDPLPFGWYRATNDEVAFTYAPGSLLFEFSGREPESIAILEKNIVLAPGKNYVLHWSVDASGVERPADLTGSGLTLHFIEGNQPISVACSSLLDPRAGRECRFSIPDDGRLRFWSMKLLFERPVGAVKLKGAVRISGFQLSSS